MDKLHHGWKNYVHFDVLQSLIGNRTGDKSAAITSAGLGLGMMTYAEVLDGSTKRTGHSREDMAKHGVGAGVSLIRNIVPDMREKSDLYMELKPKAFGGDLQLNNQLAQREYLGAVQLSGFKGMEGSPLRFAKLHFGYYGQGFTDVEKLRGDAIRRKLFIGIGFNVQQLFSKKPRSRIDRWTRGAFDYFQVPYLSVTS
jgi:hypothetical protein